MRCSCLVSGKAVFIPITLTLDLLKFTISPTKLLICTSSRPLSVSSNVNTFTSSIFACCNSTVATPVAELSLKPLFRKNPTTESTCVALYEIDSEKYLLKNSLTSIGQDDPVSESNGLLWNSGRDEDKAVARERKRRLHYVSNILVVSDPSKFNKRAFSCANFWLVSLKKK